MISLKILITTICIGVVNPGKIQCVEYMNLCMEKTTKTEWALEYLPEVRKVKVFLHCAYFEGYGRK